MSHASAPMTVAGRIDTSLSGAISCGDRVGLVACSATGNLQLRIFVIVMQCRLTLILFICAGREFNKALSSGLIVEERTRQLLESVVAEHDYRVALSRRI